MQIFSLVSLSLNVFCLCCSTCSMVLLAKYIPWHYIQDIWGTTRNNIYTDPLNQTENISHHKAVHSPAMWISVCHLLSSTGSILNKSQHRIKTLLLSYGIIVHHKLLHNTKKLREFRTLLIRCCLEDLSRFFITSKTCFPNLANAYKFDDVNPRIWPIDNFTCI